MVYRVIHPMMPIEPGIVKVKTTLKSELAKLFLANSITLTPGTLTVDVKGDDFYIHWIKVRGKTSEDYYKNIVERFESFIREIFE